MNLEDQEVVDTVEATADMAPAMLLASIRRAITETSGPTPAWRLSYSIQTPNRQASISIRYVAYVCAVLRALFVDSMMIFLWK